MGMGDLACTAIQRMPPCVTLAPNSAKAAVAWYRVVVVGSAVRGRGQGFAAMGLAECLTYLPAKHPLRPRL